MTGLVDMSDDDDGDDDDWLLLSLLSLLLVFSSLSLLLLRTIMLSIGLGTGHFASSSLDLMVKPWKIYLVSDLTLKFLPLCQQNHHRWNWTTGEMLSSSFV